MPEDIQVPSSGLGLLTWVIDSPDQARAFFQNLALLVDLEVKIVSVGNAAERKQSLFWGENNVQLPLPVQAPLGYASPTGTIRRLTFNADETTAISNPPTQAQVQAVQARIQETRQIIAALVRDLQSVAILQTQS